MEKHKVRVEMANGIRFNFTDRVRKIAATQDLNAWLKEDPQSFNKWMQETMSNIVKRMDYSII